METKFFKKGSVLFKEGDDSTEMYYIESGAVAILITTGNNESIPVGIIKKGNFVGEFAFFDEKKRSATVMMIEDTTLKIIDKTVLQSIGKNGIFIIRALVDKIRAMNEVMRDVEQTM